MLLFHMDGDAAIEFYTRCKDRGADTEEERVKILVEMVKEGLVDGISETNRTREKIIEDLSREFNVLDVRVTDINDEGVE